MSDRPNNFAPLRIDAVLCDAEREALLNGLDDLRQCLAEELKQEFPIELHFHSSLSVVKPCSLPRLVVTSLLPEITVVQEPISAVEKRLRESFSELLRDGFCKIFLCTVFRRVHGNVKDDEREAGVTRMERIRQLNFLAARLSHELDINIIDFDRSFAHIGGRNLGTDFRLQGSAALLAAKHVITSTFFAAGLDDFCSQELQEKAKLLYEHRRTGPVQPAQHDLLPKMLAFGLADIQRSGQTYAIVPMRRTLGDLWWNLRKRRATFGATIQIVYRAVRRRVARRSNVVSL
jgi:hypothetical protein